MQNQTEMKYVLEDVMKKRKKNQEAIQNKIRAKISLKNKKKQRQVVKKPQKFINQYLSAQKSYAYFKNKKKQAIHSSTLSTKGYFKKLILIVRIRGVKDISIPQRAILKKMGLWEVNSAVFAYGTKKNLTSLQLIKNYVTYGTPSKKIVKELVYKKLYGKINNERIHIKSNEQIQQHLGGQIICLEDVVDQIYNVGKFFKQITNFIYPFKLTTQEGTLVSRLRKPIQDGGHWGDRGQQINQYVSLMI